MANDVGGVPEFARDLVKSGLDTLAAKLSASVENPDNPAAKLAKAWNAMSEEERLQLSVKIVAAAGTVAATIPATIAAVRERAAARRQKASDTDAEDEKRSKKEKKKDKKKKKKDK